MGTVVLVARVPELLQLNMPRSRHTANGVLKQAGLPKAFN
jgi:hypothetical protein